MWSVICRYDPKKWTQLKDDSAVAFSGGQNIYGPLRLSVSMAMKDPLRSRGEVE